ncbi:transmembrane 220 family protein [Lutimonas sp.]|uniref:transmembrane 220 family protein n=1 Tax=Lutimonas sp. TaxID=1872403 RepID=UPI003D9BADDD
MMKKKYINWGLFLVFVLFAYLQLNDPDPVIWVLVYGTVALFFALSNFIKIPKIVFYLVILAMILFSLMHFGFFTDWLKSDDKSELVGEMVYKKPYIEGTREFMGLLIGIVALVYLSRQNSKES